MLEFGDLKKATTPATDSDINALKFSIVMISLTTTGLKEVSGHFSLSPEKTIDNLNFYCFSSSNTDKAEDLNFNNLKKCQKTDYIELLKKDKKRFLVVDFDNIVENQNTNIQKTAQYWHNRDMQLSMILVSGSSNITFTSTIKSILRKEFSLPTTST